MKTILVTGATGFIGNYVVEELLKEGFTVIASSAHKEKAINKNWFNKVIYKSLDFSSFDNNKNYYDYFLRPDLLIHLAWKGLPNYKNEFHITENLPIHTQFLKNILDNGLTDLTVTGTCFEYGMKEGCLSEEMECDPVNSYAIAKNELRKYLEKYTLEKKVNFKWIRLFYMYGSGQNPNSLLLQLEKAVANGDKVFNMSGGEQVRDYLPVEKVGTYIKAIALQNKTNGIINCCSGKGIKIIDLVENFMQKKNITIQLKKGYYAYLEYEPMSFWGDNTKLKNFLEMSDPVKEFEKEKIELIHSNAKNNALKEAAHKFNVESNKAKYSYNFSWMGRPIIQYPQDMIAMQEIIWDVKPDLIIETGIAHGGSIIYYASLLELIGNGEVLGIDIDIRLHNRRQIENHPMFKRIKMIQGSSVSEETVDEVKQYAAGKETILVCLDSNHTHEHVLKELELYSPFVSMNSYLIVFDTIVEDMPDNYLPGRIWKKSDNPKTALYEFLKKNDSFEIQKQINNKLLISVAPDGYLKRIK